MIDCAGIVITYNPDDNVIKNIYSYIDQVKILYIIDNTENENNLDLKLKKHFDLNKYKYIALKKNIGLAAALNLGIKMAIENGFEWVLTMDQDSVFYNKIINIYSCYIENHDVDRVAIISPQYKTERNRLKKTVGYDEIYWGMQSADLINLNIIKKIGFFKEDFFIDCIDYEYCLRARKNQFKLIRCNEAILIHNPAQTKKITFLGLNIKYGYTNPLRIYYQVRNALYMFKVYKNPRSIGIVLIKLGKIILLFDNKKDHIRHFKFAIFDFINKKSGKFLY